MSETLKAYAEAVALLESERLEWERRNTVRMSASRALDEQSDRLEEAVRRKDLALLDLEAELIAARGAK